MKTKRILVLIIAVIMAAAFVGCSNNESSNNAASSGGGASSTEATGQVERVRVALTASSFNIDPFGTNSIPRMWITQIIYGSLYANPFYGASLDEMEPWLARRIEKVDELTYAVELHNYIHDSKGNHITSEDIVFSYANMQTLGQQTRIGTYLDYIEIIDDYNMLFYLNKYGPGVVEFLMGDYTLSIASKSWYENATDAEIRNDPATTGAYRVASYTPGSSLVLEVVEDYWQTDENYRNSADSQNVRRIEYTVITENSMRSIALENREIDATVIDANELKRFYDGTRPLSGWNVDIRGGTFSYPIFLNMEQGKSPFADNLNLRKAVLYALDSESILYAGDYDSSTGEVLYTFGTSIMRGFQESWTDEDYFTYDPEKARDYFKASGHTEGSVNVRLLSRTSIQNGIHAVIMANLQAVGFNVELLTYDQALFNTYKVDPTQWDILLDNKGATGHIATCWDNNFNPAGFADGSSVNFTRDDHLIDLLMNVTTTGSYEDIQAFHRYLIEISILKGLYTPYNIMVGQDGILELAVNANMMPRVNAFVFAENYQSVGR